MLASLLRSRDRAAREPPTPDADDASTASTLPAPTTSASRCFRQIATLVFSLTVAAAAALANSGFRAPDATADTTLPYIPECVAPTPETLVAGPCPDGAIEPLWAADARTRRAAGAAICWWSAQPDRLADAPGIGPATARRVAAYRDEGGTLEPAALTGVRGIGPVTAARLVSSITLRCAGAPDRARHPGVDSAEENTNISHN